MAVAIVLAGFAPARPAEGGNLSLGDLAFANPQVALPYAVHRAGLSLSLPRHSTLSRSLLLAPGSYDVAVDASGPLVVEIDGESWAIFTAGSTPLQLHGWLHELTLTTLESGAVLRSLRLTSR